MTYEEWDITNHEYLQQFLDNTKDDNSDISGLIKIIIVQFFCNVRVRFNSVKNPIDNSVSRNDILQSAIDELRHCIVDLEQLLTHKDNLQ